MKRDEYQCEACKGIFKKGWSDTEAEAEYVENGFDGLEAGLVCDDCYVEFSKAFSSTWTVLEHD